MKTKLLKRTSKSNSCPSTKDSKAKTKSTNENDFSTPPSTPTQSFCNMPISSLATKRSTTCGKRKEKNLLYFNADQSNLAIPSLNHRPSPKNTYVVPFQPTFSPRIDNLTGNSNDQRKDDDNSISTSKSHETANSNISGTSNPSDGSMQSVALSNDTQHSLDKPRLSFVEEENYMDTSFFDAIETRFIYSGQQSILENDDCNNHHSSCSQIIRRSNITYPPKIIKSPNQPQAISSLNHVSLIDYPRGSIQISYIDSCNTTPKCESRKNKKEQKKHYENDHLCLPDLEISSGWSCGIISPSWKFE